MEYISSGLDDALNIGVKKSFTSIIEKIFSKGEFIINRTNLTTVGRDKYSNYITNRVGTFPLFGTSRTARVDDVYIKVNISKEIERERYRNVSQIEKLLKEQKDGKVKKTTNENLPLEVLQALNQDDKGFALLGNPGSGKTTAFKYITVMAAQGEPIRGKKRIPIFLAARDMTDNSETIWESAISFFQWLDIGTPEEVLKSLLKNGRIVLLLDGLDETTGNHQKKLLTEIEDLKIKYNKSLFCISSRPYSLSVGLIGFTKWEVLPMKFDARLEFITKWFSSVSIQKGESLISKSKARPEILDLGSSPFFLSIVCALYYNDLDVPKDVNELYSRCVEGMLGGWDAFRNIARKTILKDYSLNRRRLIVNWIAAHLFQENKVAFTPSDLEKTKCLERVSEILNKELISSENLLKTLYNDFGILVERAPKLYSFSHLSLQEYCVARYIVDNRLEITLLANYKKNKEWQEVIHLVARMLPNANEFMRYFMNSLNLRDENEIPLTLKVLEANPISSEEVQMMAFRKLATTIAGVMKFNIHSYYFENHCLVVETPTDNLTTQMQKELKSEKRKSRLKEESKAIKESEEKDDGEEENEKLKKKNYNSHRLRIFSYLPELTNVLLNSNYDLKELGVAGNSYFQLLEEANIKFIDDVRIDLIDIKKNYVLGAARKKRKKKN